MKKIWKRWIRISKKVVSVQATILLTIIYVIIIIPLGIFLQLFFKKVLLGHRNTQKIDKSYWIKRKKIKQDMRFATEQ